MTFMGYNQARSWAELLAISIFQRKLSRKCKLIKRTEECSGLLKQLISAFRRQHVPHVGRQQSPFPQQGNKCSRRAPPSSSPGCQVKSLCLNPSMLSWGHTIPEKRGKRLYPKEAAKISQHVLAGVRVLEHRSQKLRLNRQEFIDSEPLLSGRRGGFKLPPRVIFLAQYSFALIHLLCAVNSTC